MTGKAVATKTQAKSSLQRKSDTSGQTVGRTALASQLYSGAPPGMLQRQLGNTGVHAWLAGQQIQAKLRVGQPGDQYEQEADRVAEQVMRMPAPKVQRLCPECEEKLQRQQQTTEDTTPEVTPETSSAIQSLQGGGQPLPRSERSFFESRFGEDFSGVRVHNDARAANMARSVNARAFTYGRNVVFGAGQYAPETYAGRQLIAHELTHVVQQGSSASSKAIQRAGDPAAIPVGFTCPTDLSAGRPAGTEVFFTSNAAAITPAHTVILTTFRDSWVASGGTDDILIHGYASTDGAQALNWTLSCDRAQAVQAELIRLGIPAVRISIVAHGESTDFGAGAAANRHAVVTSRSPGIIPLPLITGTLTARDNFAGRSATRFGVGETVDLNFASFPPRPATDFGGLQWVLVSGGGTLTPGVVANEGTATYTAPAAAAAVQLELRVASGATAGRVISAHAITIVIPSAVRMVAVAGTAPSFSFTGPIPAGTWGAGFQANVFVDPRDVSFQGVVFGEGTVTSVVTGSFQSSFVHPVNTFGPAHGGNSVTGTPVSPPVDNIISERRGPTGTAPLIGPFCGVSDFLWAIPWEFSVAGGPRTRFAGGFTANHHSTSNFSCQARIDKAGAGPFCRNIDGTTC